jgi:hypothetical protein
MSYEMVVDCGKENLEAKQYIFDLQLLDFAKDNGYVGQRDLEVPAEVREMIHEDYRVAKSLSVGAIKPEAVEQFRYNRKKLIDSGKFNEIFPSIEELVECGVAKKED